MLGQLRNVMAIGRFNILGRTTRKSIQIRQISKAQPEVNPNKLYYDYDLVESSENDFIFRHIHQGLTNRFANVEQLASKLSTYPLLENLDEVSKDHDKLAQVLPVIRAKIQMLNQVELTSVLASIMYKTTFEYRIVKRMIDHELRWLLKDHVRTRLMDLDLWFFIADMFYECKMKSKFSLVLIKYLCDEDIELTNRQMLHLLFLIILQRSQEGILNKYEERISKLLNQATFEDTAIICMAYFKSKTPIRNQELLRKIIDKTTDYLPSVNPIEPGYCSIIKSIRYSHTTTCRENVNKLVMSLTEDSNKDIIFASPYNAVHTVKMMESFRIYQPDVLNYLRISMFQNLDKFRIKDIQYGLSSLANFAYMDLRPDEKLKQDFDILCDQIVSEKRDDVEYTRYHSIALARALAAFGYYNDKLIDYCNHNLSDASKLDWFKNILEFEKTCLLMYVGSRIEGGEVKLGTDVKMFKDMLSVIGQMGNLGTIKQDVSLSYLDFILKSSRKDDPSLRHSSSFRDMALDMAKTEQLKGPEYKLTFQHTLPHQNYTDLIISKNRPAPGPFDPETLLPSELGESETHCLIYALHKGDYFDNYRRLGGYKRWMSRLLTKLNYNVIHVDIYNRPDIVPLSEKIKRILDQGN